MLIFNLRYTTVKYTTIIPLFETINTYISLSIVLIKKIIFLIKTYLY